jgi:hypothetical protein
MRVTALDVVEENMPISASLAIRGLFPEDRWYVLRL